MRCSIAAGHARARLHHAWHAGARAVSARRSTPASSGSTRRLKQALDPHGIFV
jgi:FAD/FMN-containing dehydrogenase